MESSVLSHLADGNVVAMRPELRSRSTAELSTVQVASQSIGLNARSATKYQNDMMPLAGLDLVCGQVCTRPATFGRRYVPSPIRGPILSRLCC